MTKEGAEGKSSGPLGGPLTGSFLNVESSKDHILVPRAALPVDQPLSFELFVKVADRFIKVANSGEKIDPERLNRYLDHEKDVLYIDKGSLERFMDEKFSVIYDLIQSPNEPIEKRFECFSRCLELGYVDLKIVGPLADKFVRINMLIDWSFDHFRKRESRKILSRMIFRSVPHPLSRRAIFGTCFNLSLIFDNGDASPAAFRSYFLGSLFRDFALVTYDGKDPHMMSEDELGPDRKAEFEKHPTETLDVLRNFDLVDDITRALIEQHHERPRGDGFPHRLKRAETFLPAQYLGLADFVVTENLRCRETMPGITMAEFIEHLRKVMSEENQKNLPVLVRVIHEIF